MITMAMEVDAGKQQAKNAGAPVFAVIHGFAAASGLGDPLLKPNSLLFSCSADNERDECVVINSK